MNYFSKIIVCVACWLPLTVLSQTAPSPAAPSPDSPKASTKHDTSTTQAPGTPAGGQLSTRSKNTVDDVKASRKARKAKSGKPKETAPGDVVKNPPRPKTDGATSK